LGQNRDGPVLDLVYLFSCFYLLVFYGPLGMITLFWRLFWGLAMILSMWGLGSLALRRKYTAFPNQLALGCGAALMLGLMAALGFAHLLYPGILKLLLLTALLATVPGWFIAIEHWWEGLRHTWHESSAWEKSTILLFFGLCGFYGIQSQMFTPYLFHRVYLAHKFWQRFSFPFVADVSDSVGLPYDTLWTLIGVLLKDHYLVSFWAFCFLVALTTMVAGFSARYISPRYHYAIASVLLLTPGVAWLARTEPLILIPWFYAGASLLFLLESNLWGDTIQGVFRIGAALFFACLTILFAPDYGYIGVLLIAGGLALLAWRGKQWKWVAWALAGILLVLLAAWSPWAIRTWFITGNPFYPLTVSDLLPWFQAKFMFLVDAKPYVNAWTAAISERSWSRLNGSFFQAWEWSGTLLWTLLLPAVLLAWRVPLTWGPLLMLVLLALIEWLGNIPLTRMLILYLVPACVLYGVGVQRWFVPRRLGAMALALCTLFQAGVWLPIFMQQWLPPASDITRADMLKSVLQGSVRQDLQTRMVPDWPMVEYVNTRLNDGRRALVLGGTPLFYRSPVWQGNPRQQFLFDYDHVRSAQGLYNLYRQHGVRYVVLPQQPEHLRAMAESELLARYFQVIMKKATLLTESRGFALYELPNAWTAPPSTQQGNGPRD
jgi:hypothetical protein